MKTMPVELLLLPVSPFQAALQINATLTQRRLLSNLSWPLPSHKWEGKEFSM